MRRVARKGQDLMQHAGCSIVGIKKKSLISTIPTSSLPLKLDLYFCSHCGAVGFKCIIICPLYQYQASQFTS